MCAVQAPGQRQRLAALEAQRRRWKWPSRVPLFVESRWLWAPSWRCVWATYARAAVVIGPVCGRAADRTDFTLGCCHAHTWVLYGLWPLSILLTLIAMAVDGFSHSPAGGSAYLFYGFFSSGQAYGLRRYVPLAFCRSVFEHTRQ
jgi:hypothetical protein